MEYTVEMRVNNGWYVLETCDNWTEAQMAIELYQAEDKMVGTCGVYRVVEHYRVLEEV